MAEKEKERTELKTLDGLVARISLFPQAMPNHERMEIKPNEDYFYSNIDNNIHKATDKDEHYFYDENGAAHINTRVYKVFATSNNEKFPELPLLLASNSIR